MNNNPNEHGIRITDLQLTLNQWATPLFCSAAIPPERKRFDTEGIRFYWQAEWLRPGGFSAGFASFTHSTAMEFFLKKSRIQSNESDFLVNPNDLTSKASMA
ncbi:MAG: hypothetical protein ACREO1_06875 [Arenimonas sp.]